MGVSVFELIFSGLVHDLKVEPGEVFNSSCLKPTKIIV